MRLPDPPLLIVTDRSQARRPLPEIAEACFAAGCRWLSLREKDLPAGERHALLVGLVALGRRFDAAVMVHDDLEAARTAGAAGIHLSRHGDPTAARAALGPGALVGISAHDAAEVAAAHAGADYATLSPLFASASKPGYGPALGPAAFGAIAGEADLPLLALGGITAATAPAALAAGAAGLAVMGEVMRAPDPGIVAAGLLAALAGG